MQNIKYAKFNLSKVEKLKTTFLSKIIFYVLSNSGEKFKWFKEAETLSMVENNSVFRFN